MPQSASASETISAARREAKRVSYPTTMPLPWRSPGFVLLRERGHCARDAAHILKGEVIGDDAAPTVGPELDLLGHRLSRVASPIFSRPDVSRSCPRLASARGW